MNPMFGVPDTFVCVLPATSYRTKCRRWSERKNIKQFDKCKETVRRNALGWMTLNCHWICWHFGFFPIRCQWSVWHSLCNRWRFAYALSLSYAQCALRMLRTQVKRARLYRMTAHVALQIVTANDGCALRALLFEWQTSNNGAMALDIPTVVRFNSNSMLTNWFNWIWMK